MGSMILAFYLATAALPLEISIPKEEVMPNLNQEQTPPYLYKVLSIQNWEESQKADALTLSKDDEAFIHFSRDDQLERITSKYWAHVPKYVVLKVDTSKLSGKMVYEANPGGTSKYYHLYDGSIPLEAIAESQIVKN